MPDRLTIDTIDAELAPGARNALRVCLQLKPEERITIITDEATRDIAAALQAEVEEIGSEHAVFILENYDSRPLKGMPREILDDLATSQVSIFNATTRNSSKSFALTHTPTRTATGSANSPSAPTPLAPM